MSPLDVVLTCAAVVTAVPTAVVSLQCGIGSCVKPRTAAHDSAVAPRTVVLVPAHNEEEGLLDTLVALQQQLGPGDRILVVADNCTDRTAQVARAAGAEVAERQDDQRRGKGFALTFGFEHLRSAPPDVVVIVDADCRLNPGAIQQLARAAQATCRPVQAEYTMTVASESVLRTRVSALAFMIRNRVRPRGLAVAGLPCHLAGSGMAFPWAVLGEVMPLGSDLAEDLLLGVNLAIKGKHTLFLPEVQVESELAHSGSGQRVQRQRWERGHWATLRYALPRLLRATLISRDPRALSAALDISVPPLTLHVLLLCALMGAAFAAHLNGASSLPLALAVLQWAVFAFCVGLAWFRCGRQLLPARMLLGVPLYVLWKAPLYAQLLVPGTTGWVRAERAKAAEKAPDAAP